MKRRARETARSLEKAMVTRRAREMVKRRVRVRVRKDHPIQDHPIQDQPMEASRVAMGAAVRVAWAA